jgi:hypothetical protein
MQTCSTLRPQAQSLFWSNRDVWYYVRDLDTLPSLSSPSSPSSPRSVIKPALPLYQCPVFSSQIKHVELVLGAMTEIFWHFLPVYGDNLQQPDRDDPFITEPAARFFVDRFLSLYPSVRRLVIIDKEMRPHSPGQILIPHEKLRIRAVSILARAFPSHIAVFTSKVISKPEKSFPFERKLYRVDESSHWQLIDSHWIRQRVIPPKIPVKGIVGEYLHDQRFYYEEYIGNKRYALSYLRNEIFEKYHFGSGQLIPFQCPSHNCQEEFEQLGEYTRHINDHSVVNNRNHPNVISSIEDLEFPPTISLEFKMILIAKMVELSEDRQKHDKKLDQLIEAWGKPGTEKRRRYADCFLHQLESDPVLHYLKRGNDIKEHFLWRNLQKRWALLDDMSL